MMFGKKAQQRLARLESKVADLDRFVDSQDYEQSLRRQVQQLQEELALLTQALGMVRVHAVVNRYEPTERQVR
jgi:uncharacterized protein YlxW (UPF0749 family)